jgi:hypothetical protein
MMKRQDTELGGATNPEALKVLLERIKSRQARQTGMWRKPMQPATSVVASQSREAAVG